MKTDSSETAEPVHKDGVRLQEIARVAGVAIGTVDRALHGRKRISQATRKRILKIAKDLGYKPNLAARMLRTGCPNFRVALCIPREPDNFYGQIRAGVLEEERRFERLGVEVLYRPVERLGVGETERIKEVIQENVDGLIFTPGNPTQVTPLIDEAEKKNIRVICVASDARASSRSSVVCVEPQRNGRLAAELMSWLVPPGSQVAIVTGMLQTEDHLRKTESFSTFFPRYCPGGKTVDVIEGYDDEELAFRKCVALFERPQIVAGVYVNVGLPLAVCRALRARQLDGKVRFIGTDLFREIVPYLEKGTISACIYQNPYLQGQYALRLIIDHLLAGRPIPISHYLNPTLAMRSNLDLFRETWQLRGPENTDRTAVPAASGAGAVQASDSPLPASSAIAKID